MSSKRSRAAYESDSAAPPQHAPYAVYGTPLPAYDPDARDDGSYVPIWKQEVTDERGRKRLHGAFSGGFSAGYFNTVGSKEGWTPATFVSSRSNRAKDGKQQGPKPEDFMDEEDLAEQAESQKLETQNAFAGLGSAEEGGQRGMFADLFRNTGETMGVKLLQRMGWRQGQGVGPKVKRRAEGDAKGELHAFAPENSRMISFHRKTDRKGLGFAGEGKLEPNDGAATTEEPDGDERDARILQSKHSKLTSKPKKTKKTGFGVGVLNDNGSDEEDAYAMGPQISYNRIIGGDKKKKGGLTASNANPTVAKPVFSSRKPTQRPAASTGFRKCHDGRLPLDGFVLSLAPLTILEETKYPAPVIPEGWSSSKSSVKPGESNAAFQSTADAAKASSLDPKSRAAMLGEQQLPGKSIFDFLSPAARDRLVAASGKSNLPQALGEGAPAGFEASEADKRRTMWDLVPAIDKQTAAAALQRGISGWMPYAEDEDKRIRYRYLLELRAGLQSNLPERPRTFSVDEWAKELGEFAHAAEVFKPISGLMASRFTSSSSAPKLASDAPEPTSTPQKEEDPAEKAAKMGMYGPLTRSRLPFYPTRLLCKRFNVKPPANAGVDPGGASGAPGAATVNANKRLDVVSQASLDRMMQEANLKPAGFVSGDTEGVEANAGPTTQQQSARVDVEKNDALEGQRAGEAVFKAIFGSDDEEDQEEEEEEDGFDLNLNLPPRDPPDLARIARDRESIKDDIRDALEDIDSKGSFAAFSHLPSFVDPQLKVDPCGPIKMPLQDVDASRIIAASHQAPFGKGEQIIVDRAVRRTWELNHDQFTIENPQFAEVLSQAVDYCSQELSIETNSEHTVEAQPYKLLLYEKGALFKPHTDTEKTPGMFGTLVICLPSKHEGGQIILTQNGEQKRFSTAQCQPSFACWYSDVTHEIKEVASGYRLVLTYNLVRTRSGTATSDPRSLRHEPLRAALHRWLRMQAISYSAPVSYELMYMLEHQYTDASLRLDSLKGPDLAKAKVLKRFADEMGFAVFLASMEREVSGGCEKTTILTTITVVREVVIGMPLMKRKRKRKRKRRMRMRTRVERAVAPMLSPMNLIAA
ncbi:hypothetical protein LTR85_006208 [Meristemomyces frigidus]|nr:hypothetical protein LTR85_006208 [Meristemomyces frigidus]